MAFYNIEKPPFGTNYGWSPVGAFAVFEITISS